MPFTETHTPPTINSKITIKFAGLVLLRPNGTNMCDIGIHRLAAKHIFEALVVVDKPNLPPTVFRLTGGNLTAPMTIVANPVGTGFQVFTKDDNPFDPNASGNDPLDYRWTINMGELNPGCNFNAGAEPIATLNDGTLYTSNLSKDSLKPLIKRDTEEKRPKQIGADLAVSIDLPANGTLVMKWSEADGPKEFPLPRTDFDPPGTTYTVLLLNDPPAPSPSPHDELALYYDVLEIHGASVPVSQQWQLKYENAPKLDEIPCPPTVINP